MTRNATLRAALAALTAGLAACTAEKPPQQAAEAAMPELDGTSWVLTALGGQPPLAGTTITLRFQGGRAAGSDGCNRFSGPYAIADGTFELGPNVATTRMACPPDVMAQADSALAALTRARAYSATDGGLVLRGTDGAELATFAAQPTGLAGTAWRVTAYNNGKQAVTSVLQESELTMAFSADGRVSGSAGCNTYTGSFTESGEQVTFGPAAATRKMCAGPEGVMEQEAQFLAALATVATMTREGDRLEFRTADGALAVRAALQ